MKVYLVDYEVYYVERDIQNTDRRICGIYTQKGEAIKGFEESHVNDWHGDGWRETRIFESTVDEEYNQNDITEKIREELSENENDIITSEEIAKKVYIVDKEWYAGDQGAHPNTDRRICGIYTQKEDAINEFIKEHKNDKNDIGFHNITRIFEAIMDGKYTEKNITNEILVQLGNNKEFMLEEVKKNRQAIEYASEKLRDDKEFMLEAIKINIDSIEYASDALRNDKEVALAAIKTNALIGLKYVSEELKNDKEVLLQALNNIRIENIEFGMRYVSEELKNDKEFMLQAINNKEYLLKYASEELKNDKKFILQALEEKHTEWSGYSILAYASEELRNDKEVILQAIEHERYAIEYVSEELKNDKEVMLEAIKKDGYAIKYASEELRNDKEIVLEAVKNSELYPSLALTYANKKLKNDKEIMLEVIKKEKYYIENISEELRNNKEFMLEAIKIDENALDYASDELAENKEFIELAEKIIEEQEKAKNKEEKITPTNIEKATEDVKIGDFKQATSIIKENIKEEQEISNDEISIDEQ